MHGEQLGGVAAARQLGPDDQAFGRPVGVAVDRQGALLVADDVGNTIWRVSRSRPPVEVSTR